MEMKTNEQIATREWLKYIKKQTEYCDPPINEYYIEDILIDFRQALIEQVEKCTSEYVGRYKPHLTKDEIITLIKETLPKSTK